MSKEAPCNCKAISECLHSPHHPSEVFLLFLSPVSVEEVRHVRQDDGLAEEQRRQRGVGVGGGLDSEERPKRASLLPFSVCSRCMCRCVYSNSFCMIMYREVEY